MAIPADTQANSTHPASVSLKLLLRQLIKLHSSALAMPKANRTDSSGSSASLSSSRVMIL